MYGRRVMTAAPIRVGLLYDFPQHDGGDSFATAVQLGLDEVAATGRLDRPVELVRRLSAGLPSGTAWDVERAFAELAGEGVLGVVGPSISDNGIIVRDLADRERLPCINYTGGAITRSEFMLHYQVGSLEEEPAVLADHLLATGRRRVAIVHDRSPVGAGYAQWFDVARAPLGIELTGRADIAPLAEDATAIIEQLAAGSPDALVYLGLGVASRTVALAVEAAGWAVPVVANSALMFGYAQREWRSGWEGWVYVDTVSDDNPRRAELRVLSRSTAAGPVGIAGYDIGRLIGEGIARASHLTRAGLLEGLERVKRLPATSGRAGTTMGFGQWDHAALKGHYLVLRQWVDGHSVQYEP
ncbi:MAG: branched-chain amino acid transport system substrate-binding protein [Acidimicrobiaceae bacterium]